jgi:hypothetical protein
MKPHKINWELAMDNGAYIKYVTEHPVVNTFISSYEYVAMLPEQLSNTELVLVISLPLIGLYAVGSLLYKYFIKKNE